MTFQFRPAIKSAAKLLVGVYSESGNGKTYSSLLLARGFVGPSGTVGMLETESGRGEIYVDVIPGGYQVCSIASNFSPEEYGKAIALAEAQKFDALIIDSASHEWESIGGVLDMAAKNQADGKKGPLVWQRPKMEHAKHFVLRLMASPIPLIVVNMRAKYPMREVPKQQGGGKEWARSDKLEPKQSDDILFEMLIHGWIDAEHKYHVTKYPNAIPELRNVVKDGEPLSIETGERLKRWASGRVAPSPNGQGGASPKQGAPSLAPADTGTAGAPAYISEADAMRLEARCTDNRISLDQFKNKAGVQRIAMIKAKDLARADSWIDAAIERRKAAAAA